MKDTNYARLADNNKILNQMENGGLERDFATKPPPEVHCGREVAFIEPSGKEPGKFRILFTKDPENPPIGSKYLLSAPFKFGGKKRANSNSGGQGRAGRRQKRFGKAKH